MQPTRTLFSKASRLPMNSKMGNKDFYKGTGAAYVPGGHRTGAPGKHVITGTGKYRLVDEQVRYFVAPPIEQITNSELRPYVHTGVSPNALPRMHDHLSENGFTAQVYAKLAVEARHTAPQ